MGHVNQLRDFLIELISHYSYGIYATFTQTMRYSDQMNYIK